MEYYMKKLHFIFTSALIALFIVSLSFGQEFSRKNINNDSQAPAKDRSVVLQWDDGVNFDAIGLTSGGTFAVAARFPAGVTGPYSGYELQQVEIYINDLPSNCVLNIYDQGTSTTPGALLHTQDVTSSLISLSWNTLTLSSPVEITGDDIWVSYSVTHGAGQYPCGVDDGPAVVDGDWIYDGSSWQRLSVIAPTLNYNWNIHAILEEGGGGGEAFFEDFETFVAGQQVACQDPANWTTWSNAPCGTEDAYISTNYAHSGANSFVIVPVNDFVKPLGDKTTGIWYIDFWMYVPTGMTGYFNTLNTFPASATGHWAMEVYFGYAGPSGPPTPGQAHLLSYNPDQIDFAFSHDTWLLVSVIVDLDNDNGQFWVNNTMIHSWQWTRNDPVTYALRLAANDFFGPSQTATDEAYYDDYRFADTPLPVELTSFAANVNSSGHVVLNWSTASELNNQMFEIERKAENSEFVRIGYVNGYGTTTEPKDYSYTDQTVGTGNYYYRLKQVDFNGSYEYSEEIFVEVNGPLTFGIKQNYPNPFNPSTRIAYSVPVTGNVKLAVYNLVGEEVAVLVNGQVEAGFYETTFDASNLPSGLYLYKLQSDNTVEVKKMMLLK
jgi:hypothetical protein